VTKNLKRGNRLQLFPVSGEKTPGNKSGQAEQNSGQSLIHMIEGKDISLSLTN